MSEALRPFSLPTPTNVADTSEEAQGSTKDTGGPGTEDNCDSAIGGAGDTVSRHNRTEGRAEEPGGEAWQGNGQAAATVTGNIA